MLKLFAAVTLSVLSTLTIGSLPTYAQPNSSQISPNPERLGALTRAKNLARVAAESANGGLGNYRAESSMHGPATEAPYVDNENGTWTFTFKGSVPGTTTPTVESVVTVAKDGSEVTVNYNGPIRSNGR